MKHSLERFTLKDVLQIIVGSFGGALAYVYTDFREFGDGIPFANSILIILLSLFLAFAIAYLIGVRRLGNRKMLLIFGFIPARIIVHYASAVLSSAFILYLLGINNLATPLAIIFNRIVIIALPATVFGSAVDLIGSQK